ncbi:hypothetical protein [Parabacteroides faecis]|uniref:hypothetical protein n=1 Tax=Parabacteroides faecis TaxID=1217282 RepID=UPI003521AF71
MKTNLYVCTNENIFFIMDRNKYESLIPYGYKSVIAERSGVTRQTVSAFFKGRTNCKKIEDTILDVIAELKNQKEAKLKKAGLL